MTVSNNRKNHQTRNVKTRSVKISGSKFETDEPIRKSNVKCKYNGWLYVTIVVSKFKGEAVNRKDLRRKPTKSNKRSCGSFPFVFFKLVIFDELIYPFLGEGGVRPE